MTRSSALTGLVLAAVAVSTLAAEPVAHPVIAIVDAATVEAQCDVKLAEFRSRMKAMEAVRSSKGVFEEWNRLSVEIDDFAGPIGAAINLSTDKATREASDACVAKLAPFSTELFQSEALYARVRDAKPVDATAASRCRRRSAIGSRRSTSASPRSVSRSTGTCATTRPRW
jgi:thimet oligopeptidase